MSFPAVRGTHARRAGMPVPPARMALVRDRRPLKRWRWVGVFGPELFVVGGDVHVGLARQQFWAVWDRDARRLHERTRLRARPLALAPGRFVLRDGDIAADLTLDEGPGVETLSPHGRSYIWTCKQGGIAARGEVTIAGERRAVDARAIVDESAGYHARRTAWLWSAGVGRARDGRALAWNLVHGVHDAPRDSERSVWVDGEPREVGPVRFAEDLSAVAFAEGGELRFAREAVRERTDELLVFASRYECPLGTFTGVLPGGLELAEGYGVMERHRARW